MNKWVNKFIVVFGLFVILSLIIFINNKIWENSNGWEWERRELSNNEILSEDILEKEALLIWTNPKQAYIEIEETYYDSQGKSVGNLNNFVRISLELWKYQEVINFWEKSDQKEENFKKFSEALWDIVLAYIYLWDEGKATILIEKYIKKYPILNYKKGLLLFKQKKYTQAIEALEKTSFDKNRHVTPLFFIGASYKMLWDNNKAITIFQRVYNYDLEGDREYILKTVSSLELIKLYLLVWNDNKSQDFKLLYTELKNSQPYLIEWGKKYEIDKEFLDEQVKKLDFWGINTSL